MKAEVVQTASPLVIGTYAIAGVSPSTDMVAAIFGGGITAANNSTIGSMRFLMGFTDLRQSISLSCTGEDAQASASAGYASSLSIVNCLNMINGSGSGVSAPVATYLSTASNGVNLNLTIAPGTGRLTNTTLLSGADIEAECGSDQFAGGDTSKAQTYAHLHGTADLIIILTSIGQTGGDTAGTGMCIGYFDGTNSSSVSYRATTDAVGTTDNVGWASANSTAEILSASASLAHQTITSSGSGGFTITLNTNPGVASMVGWIALRGLSTNMYRKAFLTTLPTATGNTALVTGMAGAPTCLLAHPGRITTSAAAQNNDQAGCLSLGMAATETTAGSTKAANSCTFKYGVATSVAKHMMATARALQTQDNAGTDVVAATVHTWDSGGVTMNYTAVNASAVYCPGVAFGMPVGSATNLDVAQGPFTYTGQSATFSTSETNNKYLLAAAANYNYSIAHASSDVELTADTTAYLMTGEDISLPVYSFGLVGNVGIYAYQGKPVTFTLILPPDPMIADSGTYSYTGMPQQLDASALPPFMLADTGFYSMTGFDAVLTFFNPGTFPNVIGLPLSMAQEALEASGAVNPAALGYFGTWPITILWTQDQTAPQGTLMGPGIVVEQRPLPFSPIVENHPVLLTVTEAPLGLATPPSQAKF